MSQQLRLADHISLTTLDNEAVLLDLKTGAYFGLNHVGLALIESLNNGATQQSAVDELAANYKTPVEQVTLDAQHLIDEMLEKQLLLAE